MQKRKPLVSYPISPRSKVKSLSQKSVINMPNINVLDESKKLINISKVSRKAEKYLDDSDDCKSSLNNIKRDTVKNQKKRPVRRRTITKQVFIIIRFQNLP